MMNTFYAPTLAGMIYAMPGMRDELHAVLNKPGKLRGLLGQLQRRRLLRHALQASTASTTPASTPGSRGCKQRGGGARHADAISSWKSRARRCRSMHFAAVEPRPVRPRPRTLRPARHALHVDDDARRTAAGPARGMPMPRSTTAAACAAEARGRADEGRRRKGQRPQRHRRRPATRRRNDARRRATATMTLPHPAPCRARAPSRSARATIMSDTLLKTIFGRLTLESLPAPRADPGRHLRRRRARRRSALVAALTYFKAVGLAVEASGSPASITRRSASCT